VFESQGRGDDCVLLGPCPKLKIQFHGSFVFLTANVDPFIKSLFFFGCKFVGSLAGGFADSLNEEL
jgi:hypothetical protein